MLLVFYMFLYENLILCVCKYVIAESKTRNILAAMVAHTSVTQEEAGGRTAVNARPD